MYGRIAVWRQDTVLNGKVGNLIFQPQKKQNNLSSKRHAFCLQPYYLIVPNRESISFNKVIRFLRDGAQSEATEVVFSNLRSRNKVFRIDERDSSTNVLQKVYLCT